MSSSCFPFVLPMLLFCLPNVFQMYLFSLPSVFLLCHYSVFLTSNALLVLFSLLPSGQLNKKIFQELQRWFCNRHVNCFQAAGRKSTNTLCSNSNLFFFKFEKPKTQISQFQLVFKFPKLKFAKQPKNRKLKFDLSGWFQSMSCITFQGLSDVPGQLKACLPTELKTKYCSYERFPEMWK